MIDWWACVMAAEVADLEDTMIGLLKSIARQFRLGLELDSPAGLNPLYTAFIDFDHRINNALTELVESSVGPTAPPLRLHVNEWADWASNFSGMVA